MPVSFCGDFISVLRIAQHGSGDSGEEPNTERQCGFTEPGGLTALSGGLRDTGVQHACNPPGVPTYPASAAAALAGTLNMCRVT